jgi:hypothetical protein
LLDESINNGDTWHESLFGVETAYLVARQAIGRDSDVANRQRVLWDRLLLVREDFEVKGGLAGAHRLLVPWGMGLELPTAIGATAGAFVGAVVACWAARIGEKGRPQSPM